MDSPARCCQPRKSPGAAAPAATTIPSGTPAGPDHAAGKLLWQAVAIDSRAGTRGGAADGASSPSLSPAGSARVQRTCAACGKEDAQLRRQTSGTTILPAPGAPAAVHETLHHPGQSLPAALRTFFEAGFEHDFSGVRVHADRAAAAAAEALDARAFTLGSHIAFASNQYAPASRAGRRLLAHELAHVVQQRNATGPMQRALAVSAPGDADERAADAAAEAVLAGRTVRLAGGGAPTLHRAVREAVVERTQPGAQACMLHLHGDEQNGRQVALSLFGTHCANFVDLATTARPIHVDLASGGPCLADPNRIFTPTGIASHAIVGGCAPGSAAHTQAQSDLVAFRDQRLIPAIATCRGNPGGGMSGGLPLVAFHNNTAISIRSYRPSGAEAGAVEHDPARTGGAANPAEAPGRHPHDFMLATDPRDFQALRAAHNVVLQSATPTDDGSASVALANDRYVNIEGFGPSFTDANSRFFLNNMGMALDVFRQLGVGRKPCGPQAPGDPLAGIVDFLSRLFGEIGRVLGQMGSLPDPLPRDAVPNPPPRGCRVFADPAALDARKADWASVVGGMPVADVVSWIIGASAPPAAARSEADRQRACMMTALAASGRLPAGTSTAPVSGYRNFADQGAIWRRKFDFVFHGHGDRRNRFDSITDHARTRCGSLIAAADVQWDTENPSHRACWGAAPLPAAPAAPSGGPLSADERQQEILRASSAPGISRHHFGTDFDFFSVEPSDWAPGGRFFDALAWLRANAATWGFVQTFTPFSTFMRLGYMEERWHWSYLPIAQALLEFVQSHQGDIEAHLTSPARWGSDPRFSFIRAHWREFMFNVEQSP